MSKRKANAAMAADDVERQPMTTWRQEAHAMRDACIITRRLALSLPEGSGVREAFLDEARRWATAARVRGVEAV
jgi:hypothetical protein